MAAALQITLIESLNGWMHLPELQAEDTPLGHQLFFFLSERQRISKNALEAQTHQSDSLIDSQDVQKPFHSCAPCPVQALQSHTNV